MGLLSQMAIPRNSTTQTAAAMPIPGVRIDRFTPDEWPGLRDLRLAALHDSPSMFLATWDRERSFDPRQWEDEFKRGDWYRCTVGERPIGLMGITREADDAPEHYIEYMWISPDFRRFGLSRRMLSTAFEDLRLAGVRQVHLWVLNGNDVAVRLYERLGFTNIGAPQPLPDRPERSEQRMVLALDQP